MIGRWSRRSQGSIKMEIISEKPPVVMIEEESGRALPKGSYQPYQHYPIYTSLEFRDSGKLATPVRQYIGLKYCIHSCLLWHSCHVASLPSKGIPHTYAYHIDTPWSDSYNRQPLGLITVHRSLLCTLSCNLHQLARVGYMDRKCRKLKIFKSVANSSLRRSEKHRRLGQWRIGASTSPAPWLSKVIAYLRRRELTQLLRSNEVQSHAQVSKNNNKSKNSEASRSVLIMSTSQGDAKCIIPCFVAGLQICAPLREVQGRDSCSTASCTKKWSCSKLISNIHLKAAPRELQSQTLRIRKPHFSTFQERAQSLACYMYFW